ncbi:MAG: hypothetical protein ACQ9IQ_14315 [Nitrospirales bacterium]
MRPNSFITCLFSILIMVVGVTQVVAGTTSTTTVEFSSAIHFLNPAGEDVEVGPGVYQVEAVESWLKLLPVGESRSAAVLLEANREPHEEEISEPVVRTLSDPDHPEVLHLAFLMPDGIGMEAVGTITGIRPRGLSLAFVGRKSKAQTLASRPRTSAPRPGSQTQAPPPRPKGQPVDCGPFQKVIGKSTRHSPALAVFQNALHLVTSNLEPPPTGVKKFIPAMSIHLRESSPLKHWIYANGQWEGKDIEGQLSKTHVAIAPFQGRLHMVHIGGSSNDLWYSTYDGSRWTPNVKISGQKSKVAPSLAVWNNQLHMVHLGDSSNAIWHSINKGNGWTVNVRIPGRSSDKVPALGRVPNGPFAGRLHMVYKTDANIEPQSLWHAQFDGRQWRRSAMIRGALTKAAPTLVSGYPDQLHLIHLGKSSNDLWHMLFGPNKRKNNSVEWFDERRLLSEKSEVPVGVALFQGCYHMVSIKDDKLMHTTFSTPQVHPTVR